MTLTASKLRENIYKILDQVLETGIPVEIERGGRILRIVPAQPSGRSKLDLLEEHPGSLLCDAEDLVHLDWSDHWKPGVVQNGPISGTTREGLFGRGSIGE